MGASVVEFIGSLLAVVFLGLLLTWAGLALIVAIRDLWYDNF